MNESSRDGKSGDKGWIFRIERIPSCSFQRYRISLVVAALCQSVISCSLRIVLWFVLALATRFSSGVAHSIPSSGDSFKAIPPDNEIQPPLPQSYMTRHLIHPFIYSIIHLRHRCCVMVAHLRLSCPWSSNDTKEGNAADWLVVIEVRR